MTAARAYYAERIRFGRHARPIICGYSGKRKYGSRDDADDALVELRRRGRNGEKSAYLCVVCENFHLTSEKH